MSSMQRLQYLESMDSVRMTAPGAVNVSIDRNRQLEEMSQLQSFLEVLMTLALGRTVVVPQSYAFDSWAFLTVAERVLQARGPSTASADRPFRLHLFGAGIDSFDDAVRSMLARVHDPQRPFVSSLLPGLSELDPQRLTRMSGDLPSLLRWADDRVSPPLESVMNEFRHLQPVQARPRKGVNLGQMLADLVDPSSAMWHAATQMDEPSREVHSILVESVRALDPARPASFGQRSGLRHDAPWPGDPEGRSAGAIVGEDELALVTEFVDTLYNRVVVDSIGVAPATFSTSVALGEDLRRARLVAQRLALGTARSGDASRAVQDETPLFEVRLRPEALRDNAAVSAEAGRLLALGSDELAPLLHARSEVSHRQRRSPFWDSVDRLDRAVLEGEEREMDRALEPHLKLVTGLLGGRAELGMGGGRRVQLVLTAAGAALPSIAASTFGIPGLVGVGLTAAGAVAPGAVGYTSTGIRRWRECRRMASALGEFVGVSPAGGTS